MAEVTRTTAKSYFETGDIPTQSQFSDFADSVFWKDESIRGINNQTGHYTLALSDASKLVRMNSLSSRNVTVPQNSTVAFAIGTQIMIRQANSGDVTLIPDTSVVINSGTVIIGGQNKDIVLTKVGTNEWDYSPGTPGTTGGGADVTAPTVSSRTAINATTIRVVFSEVVTATNVGHSFKKNGSALTPSAVSGSGTNTLDFTVPTMLGSDTLLHSYNSGTGDTMDAATNELVAFTDAAITNSIGGDVTAPTVTSRTATTTTNIQVVLSEVVTATNVGHSFKKNGSALTPSAISGSGSNTLNFTVPTMAFGDTLLHSYDSSTGDTLDAATNELASFTDAAVTNSIGDPNGTPTLYTVGDQLDGLHTKFGNNATWSQAGSGSSRFYYQPGGSLPTDEAARITIPFTKGFKFIAEPVGNASWYTGANYIFTIKETGQADVVFDNIVDVEGAILKEYHPNTGTAKTLLIGKGSAGGGAVGPIVCKITLYA